MLKKLGRCQRCFNMLDFDPICFYVYIEIDLIVHVDLLHKAVGSQFTASGEHNVHLEPKGHLV